MARKEKKNLEKLLEKFAEYLKDFEVISNDSKKSYISYVRKAIKHFEKHYNNEIKFEETVWSEFDNTCTLVNDYLYKIKCGKIEDVSSKTARNYFSAFILFQDMLLNDKCSNTKNELKKYLKNVTYFVYSKNGMDKRFLSRLTTQDRKYTNIKFPTRILNKKLKPWFRNKLTESIENVTLYGKGGKKYEYKNLEILILNMEDNGVYFYLKNNPHSRIRLYTPDKYYNKYEPFLAKETKEAITLDHEVSLKKLVEGKFESYNYLKALSDKIDVVKKKTKTSKERKEYVLKDETFFDDEKNVEGLKEDLDKIFSEIKLVAMRGKYNSSKGKNNVV